MTRIKIIEHENLHQNQITLRREGLFWRAYEQSAFLLQKHFWAELKVNGSFVKAVNQDVFYVGTTEKPLQERVLDKLHTVAGCYIKERTESTIVIAGVPSIEGFEKWKQGRITLREEATEKMQAFYGHLPLYKAGQDLFKRLVEITKNFSRNLQYSLGDRLINHGLDLYTLLYRLLKIPKEHKTQERKAAADRQKVLILKEADETIEQIRFLLQTSYELKLYPVETLAKVSQMIESIRKQLHGISQTVGKV